MCILDAKVDFGLARRDVEACSSQEKSTVRTYFTRDINTSKIVYEKIGFDSGQFEDDMRSSTVSLLRATVSSIASQVS